MSKDAIVMGVVRVDQSCGEREHKQQTLGTLEFFCRWMGVQGRQRIDSTNLHQVAVRLSSIIEGGRREEGRGSKYANYFGAKNFCCRESIIVREKLQR